MQHTNPQNNKFDKDKYFDHLLSLTPSSVYWKNLDGVYLGCNLAMLKMIGVSFFEEIIGKTDYDLSWNESADTLRKNDQKVIQSGKLHYFEETGKLSDGAIQTMITNKMPLVNKEDKIIGIIGSSIDITPLKKSTMDLILAKEKAEVANQAKTEFLENMRHDIRTPLSGIVGCAHLIQMQSNNPKKVKEYTSDLIQSSNALLEFLNKILESLKVASGEMPLLKKRFSLKAALEQIVRLNKSQAIVKGLVLSLSYDEAIPTYLLGDLVRLQRIILELVTNALKYTDKGEIKVSARLIKNKKREVIIELGVNDTGMGIPRDKQQEIYTRFTRITPSYQGIYPGTGLGLSVVKQFIDEMGGEIQLDSRPNQGSTFTCFIPLQEALSPARDEYETDETLSFSKDAAARTQKVNEVSELPEMPVTGSRVLVVEDNAIAAKVAQNVLSNLNCSIDIAPDGKTALTSIEKNHYELILMDIGLPNDDGYDVTRRIRLKQWQRNSLVPIIGLTAHVDEEKKRCCLENGMNAIYNKPLTPERASEILHVFLSHSQTLTPTSKEKHDELSNNQLHALPLLDKKKAIRLLGTDETFQELLELLVSGLTKEIAALKQYHQDTDWQSIRALAHKWEGGTNYCGASRLEHACKEIRRTLRMPEKSEIMYQTLLHVAEETNKAAREILEKE